HLEFKLRVTNKYIVAIVRAMAKLVQSSVTDQILPIEQYRIVCIRKNVVSLIVHICSLIIPSFVRGILILMNNMRSTKISLREFVRITPAVVLIFLSLFGTIYLRDLFDYRLRINFLKFRFGFGNIRNRWRKGPLRRRRLNFTFISLLDNDFF